MQSVQTAAEGVRYTFRQLWQGKERMRHLKQSQVSQDCQIVLVYPECVLIALDSLVIVAIAAVYQPAHMEHRLLSSPGLLLCTKLDKQACIIRFGYDSHFGHKPPHP